jgi:hypothetical protein
MIFCYKDYIAPIDRKMEKGKYVWIDGIKNAERVIYGPFINWKQAVTKGDEMMGRNNYNCYHTVYSNMRDFVNSLNCYGKVQ